MQYFSPCYGLEYVSRQLYNTFDVEGDGQVDWRCMLVMLRAAMNPQVSSDRADTLGSRVMPLLSHVKHA